MASRRVRQAGSVEPHQASNGSACSICGVAISLEPLPRFMVVMNLVGIGGFFEERLRESPVGFAEEAALACVGSDQFGFGSTDQFDDFGWALGGAKHG